MSERSEQEASANIQDRSSKDQMVIGSAWMTAGSIFSRILGAIYVIPWSIWFGSYFLQGNALYGKGYNIYSFFLLAAIAGVPSAIAKQVAHYNALNEYGIGVRLYKRGLVLAVITGVLSAVILYFGAPLLTGGDPNVIPVLHSLAWAILVIPAMSLTRGYFQGYQQMAPSAISQFVEQVARVIYMLVTAFLIMRVWHGSWVTAVSQSTFAAFIGAIAGFLILGVYYVKRRSVFTGYIENSNNDLVVSGKELYREIISQAVPFIILGAGITIFQLIDQYTFFPVMKMAGSYTMARLNDFYALFAANSNKLIMITVSLSSALAIAAVPLLSEAFTRGDKQDVRRQISDALLLFMFVMLPSALGMAAVARPLNILFYGQAEEALGSSVLAFSSYVSILLGLFTVMSAVMQGISQNKLAVRYFAIGTGVKLLLQWPAIYFLGTFGPLAATLVGLGVTCLLILRSLHLQFGLSFNPIANKANQILGLSIATFVIARLLVLLVGIFGRYGRIASMVALIIAVAGAAGFYIYMVLRTRLADEIMGPRVGAFRRILHIK
ncbi:putative polysaccharide biosynthesis protein [Levilactobacillus bambusae]|uniref:Transporter n=1 Tax=Levilactobacillus bambusae TaxID=2024736 RepID=A0A2V1N1G6_9LACO|nr:polysaccharide biosynthesis protein [Levilactobacillus bambusae]PWG01087.1 transporter [Levilactobacillus bambusae]